MKIKTRSDILHDVINEGKKHPKGWKAVFGRDNKLLSNDYYIYHPKTGIYLLKEYEKNPYEIKGIGSQITRYVDEDIDAEISKYAGDFGIIQGDFKKIYRNLKKGTHPDKIFDAAIRAKDADIDRLEQSLESMRIRIEKGSSVVEDDADFHLAISEATHNKIQMHLMFSIYDMLKESLRKYYENIDLRDIYGQHYKVVDAIKKKDAHLARRRMLEHLEYVESSVKELIGSS